MSSRPPASQPQNSLGTMTDGVYLEPRWLTGAGIWVLIAAVGPGVIYLAFLTPEDPEDFRRVALAVVGLLILMLLLFVSPLTSEFRHIRIDQTGLTLWWARYFHLPADQIGEIEVVPEDQAMRATRRHRYRGLRIQFGRSTYAARGYEGPAVFVEQRRPGKEPVGWLLSTRDADAVVAALDAVRHR